MSKKSSTPFSLDGFHKNPDGSYSKTPTQVQPRDRAMGKSLPQILQEQTMYEKPGSNAILHGSTNPEIEVLNKDGWWAYTQNKEVHPPNYAPIISFDVDPRGATRLSSSDQWKVNPNHPDPEKRQRPAVTKYYMYKDRLRKQAEGYKFDLPAAGMHMFFYMEMPQSWSKKKKQEMVGTRHQVKPDADNILKGIQDALCKNDSYVWDVRITKKWAWKGSIDIYLIS